MKRFLPVLQRMGLTILGMILFLAVLIAVQIPLHRAKVPNAAGAPIALAVALLLYIAIQRFLEHRAPIELRLKGFVTNCLAGLAVGTGLFAATIGILALTGAYHAQFAGVSYSLIGTFVAVAAGAAGEELLFRGFLYRMIRDAFGMWWGVAVSAILFGAAHAFNSGATVYSSIAIALEAGVLLSLAFELTGTLWFAIAIHTAWNFAEGPIFGTALSGGTTVAPVLRGTLHGPAILTGGAFGPEASIVALAVCLTMSLVFAFAIFRRTGTGAPVPRAA